MARCHSLTLTDDLVGEELQCLHHVTRMTFRQQPPCKGHILHCRPFLSLATTSNYYIIGDELNRVMATLDFPSEYHYRKPLDTHLKTTSDRRLDQHCNLQRCTCYTKTSVARLGRIYVTAAFHDIKSAKTDMTAAF